MKAHHAPRRGWPLWMRPPARTRGQSLVEFGLIALTLVFLIGAGVDLGLMVTVRQTVSVITGEATRQVAYGASVQDVFDTADRAATGTLANTSGLMLSLLYCPPGAVNGNGCHSYCNLRFLASDPVRPQPCYAPPPKTTVNRVEQPGWAATLSVWEEKYEILTPWIRAWAALPSSQDDLCQQSNKPCYMRLTSSEMVIYPGPARVKGP